MMRRTVGLIVTLDNAEAVLVESPEAAAVVEANVEAWDDPGWRRNRGSPRGRPESEAWETSGRTTG